MSRLEYHDAVLDEKYSSIWFNAWFDVQLQSYAEIELYSRVLARLTIKPELWSRPPWPPHSRSISARTRGGLLDWPVSPPSRTPWWCRGGRDAPRFARPWKSDQCPYRVSEKEARWTGDRCNGELSWESWRPMWVKSSNRRPPPPPMPCYYMAMVWVKYHPIFCEFNLKTDEVDEGSREPGLRCWSHRSFLL